MKTRIAPPSPLLLRAIAEEEAAYAASEAAFDAASSLDRWSSELETSAGGWYTPEERAAIAARADAAEKASVSAGTAWREAERRLALIAG